MKFFEVFKLLNDSNVSKFVKKNWIKVNDLSGGQYSVNENISFKTSMLRSDLCDCSDTYISVKGKTYHFVAAGNENYKEGKEVAFKNKYYLGHTYQKITTHW